MAGCGYTPAEIDAMPAQDVIALLAFWREQPPAHEILCAAYGLKAAAPQSVDDPSGVGALIVSHPDGRVPIGAR